MCKCMLLSICRCIQRPGNTCMLARMYLHRSLYLYIGAGAGLGLGGLGLLFLVTLPTYLSTYLPIYSIESTLI